MYLYIYLYIYKYYYLITLYNNSYKHSIIINRLIKKKKCVYLFLFKTFVFKEQVYKKKKKINEKTKSVS